jgi:hypothetical protein
LRLDGQLKADLSLTWAAASATRAASTRLQLASLSLNTLALTADKAHSLASIKQVQLGDVAGDMEARTVHFGSVMLTQPTVRVARDQAGCARCGTQRFFCPADPRRDRASEPKKYSKTGCIPGEYFASSY